MKSITLKLVMIYCCYFSAIQVQAQISGQVFERVSRKAIAKVDIINVSRGVQVLSKTNGEFNIAGGVNDILIFKFSGYRADTLLVTDLKPLRRYLEPETNMLNTITVKGNTDIREQYAETFNKANGIQLKKGRGLLFSPSTYFGKEGKDARRLKQLLKQDEIEKQIDQRFNVKSVTAVLPLKQPELDAFMVKYRPTLAFVKRADADDFKFYLIDAYNKFKVLPPEQRVLPPLKIERD